MAAGVSKEELGSSRGSFCEVHRTVSSRAGETLELWSRQAMKCCKRGLMGDSRGLSWKIRVESNVYSGGGGPVHEVSKGKKKDSLGTRLEATHVIFW